MLLRRLGWITALLATSHLTAAAGATDPCKLTMYPGIPVKMDDLRPVITAGINGVDARFIVDTGSFFDFLSPAAAAQFGLPLSYAPPFFHVNGVGGPVVPRIATVRTFTVAGITSRNAQFLVGNNDFLGGQIGILGQNIFRIADVDYDFAEGELRFIEPQHCGKEALVYWTKTQPIGVVDLHWTSSERPYLIGKATVNGHDVQVLFDTGSPRTILSLDAARRAGITPDSPGVVEAGVTSGLGKDTVKVWVAPIASFRIGGETIERTHVLMGDIGLPDLGIDMLLGSDFFLAHHIYVAYSQDKLYFTYNGGVVFDLNARRPVGAPGTQKTPADDSHATATADTPMDAAGFMRRGMADASRHEYPEAITDLTHACNLDPTNADCRYQRGLAYLHSAQRESALADFSEAIRLQPNDFEAHLSRAQLELPERPADAETDLDAVDRFAPQQADLRLMVAQLYGAAGQNAGAVHQYDVWIDYHPRDIRLPSALSSRCGSEAAANLDLDRALEDCNAALSLMPQAAAPFSTTTISNRGFVYLRQGKLDSALADFDAALKLQPGLPVARYGRGLVEIHKGLQAEGQADLIAVQSQHPDLAKHLAGLGFAP